jgi:nucleotide-binding universal stress UspA family protein
MRILFATDGSTAADRARDLLAGLRLPHDTYIRVAGVRRHGSGPVGSGWPFAGGQAASIASAEVHGAATAVAIPVEDHLSMILDTAVGALEGPGRRVERVILDGRPGSAIVDQAREMAADLVVVGNRGHGTIESMLLGSVSREVVDHVRCSVLVVRGTGVQNVLFATDGSQGARLAERAIGAWPMFADSTIRACSVAQTTLPTPLGGAPGLYDQVIEQYEEDVDEARRSAASEAESAAKRLTDAGLRVSWEQRDGDPAGEVLRAAAAREADLIVTGTRGNTGLSRLLLGSVAGNVAGHAHCSVLVVREASPA